MRDKSQVNKNFGSLWAVAYGLSVTPRQADRDGTKLLTNAIIEQPLDGQCCNLEELTRHWGAGSRSLERRKCGRQTTP